MARKKAEPKAKPAEAHSAALMGLMFQSHGLTEAKADVLVKAVSTDYQFANLDRVDRLTEGLLDWMGENAVEGGSCAATTTEALIALQHVSYRIFDSVREHEQAHAVVSTLLEASKNANAPEHTHEQKAAPAKPPSDDPSQLYR